jgi:hypothetical protein
MAEQHGTGLLAHPYRVLVLVLPLDLVIKQTAAIETSLGLLRGRDTITPYMYLPPLAGVFESERVACLFRPTLVSDDMLRDPPRRVAQLQPPARQHLKVKLAAYWRRAAINPDDLPLHERGEDEPAARHWRLRAPTTQGSDSTYSAYRSNHGSKLS